MTVGERIRQRRLELNLTQEELAKRLNYRGKSAVCRVEKEENNITTDRIRKFAKALDCEPAYLMGWIDTPYKALNNFAEGFNELSKTFSKTMETVIQGINEEEALLIESYRNLNESEKAMIRRMMEYDKKVDGIKKREEKL